MTQAPRHYKTQLAVIGSGLAGFAASLFALERDISTAQVGSTGAIAYTTGYFDLLGSSGHGLLDNPWAGLDVLRSDEPAHPLSRIDNDDIRSALTRFTLSLSGMGIGYTPPGERNLFAPLASGATKPTLSVPCTMQSGIEAKRANAKTLIIDFTGLMGFSAREMIVNLKSDWPQLSSQRLEFPGMENGRQLFPEVMARALEVPANQERLAERIKNVLGDADYVGMPAIMGIHMPDGVHARLERLVGLPLFEIPTMPPSVPGIRLREMFEQAFPARGLTLVPQQNVKRVVLNEHGATLYLQDSYGEVVIESQSTILATGRFLSGGLKAARSGVSETLLNIPVSQPANRDDWYRQDYFDPRGHPINRSGIEVDTQFRPLGRDGKPVNKRLFAAGVLLAHQDWIRQRCGAGVAIASAYKAVESVAQLLTKAG